MIIKSYYEDNLKPISSQTGFYDPYPQTYRAILQGSQITWIDTPPDLPPGTEIYVTVTQSTSNRTNRRQAMAAALTKLAQVNPFRDIDPLLW